MNKCVDFIEYITDIKFNFSFKSIFFSKVRPTSITVIDFD